MVDLVRLKRICAQHSLGDSLQNIGLTEGISRQRVSQLLNKHALKELGYDPQRRPPFTGNPEAQLTLEKEV